MAGIQPFTLFLWQTLKCLSTSCKQAGRELPAFCRKKMKAAIYSVHDTISIFFKTLNVELSFEILNHSST